MTDRRTYNIAMRVALAYALVACVWILGSALVVLGLPEPLGRLVEIGKGLAFVLVTASLLYVFLARWTGTLIARLSRAEEAVRQVDRINDRLPVGVVVLDGNETVEYANRTAEMLLRRQTGDLGGRSFAQVWDEAGADESVGLLPQLLGTGGLAGGFVLRGAAAKARTLSASAAPIDPGRSRDGWVVVLVDDSEAHASLRKTVRLLAGYRFASLVSSEVGRTTSGQQLLGRLCEIAIEPGGFAGAWAVVRDRFSDDFVDAGMIGLGPVGRRIAAQMRSEASDSSAMLARVRAGEIIYQDNAAEDSPSGWSEAALEGEIGSYTAFGIEEGGRLLAVIALFAHETGFFGVEERELVETVRADVAFALDRLTLDHRRLDAEEALSESENAYRRLFEDNPLPMWVYDLETLDFLAVNDSAVAKYGYTRDEFLRRTIKDIRPAADVAPLIDHVARKGTSGRFEDAGYWTHVDSSGREFPVHVLSHATDWVGHRAQLVLVQEVAQVR